MVSRGRTELPEPRDPKFDHPYVKPYTLGDAAKDGLLIIVRCNLCHKLVHYLAADLAALLGQERRASAVPFPCTKCRTAEFMDVRIKSPDLGDYGHLTIRRPAGVKKTQLWKSERLCVRGPR